MSDKLSVFNKQYQIGTLLHEDGLYLFKYNTQNSDDFISLTMPVRARDYVHTKLHPFFEMYLPEAIFFLL